MADGWDVRVRMMVAGPGRFRFLWSGVETKGGLQGICKRQNRDRESVARGVEGKQENGLSQKPQLLPRSMCNPSLKGLSHPR